MNDLSNVIATERTIDIKHPATGVPVGLSITLLPDSHKQVREVARRAIDERLSGKAGKPTAEKLEQGRTDMLVASVGGWEWKGALTFRGKKPDLTAANVRAVFTELPWVAEQVDLELGDRAAFFRSTEAAAG